MRTTQLVGFDVEVAQADRRKAGREGDLRRERMGRHASPGWTPAATTYAANGVEVTPERAEKYDFSTPYAYIRTALIVRGDYDDIQSFEDLKGKNTANTIASTYATLAESYGATAAGVDDAGSDHRAGARPAASDATLNAEVSFYDYMNVHPDANLKVVALTDEASKVSLPMRKEERSASLLAAVNQAIAELDAEGELTRISEKYFGKDITKAEQ